MSLREGSTDCRLERARKRHSLISRGGDDGTNAALAAALPELRKVRVAAQPGGDILDELAFSSDLKRMGVLVRERRGGQVL